MLKSITVAPPSSSDGKNHVSYDGPNPAHVSFWRANNPTLWDFCVSMTGRADIEGSKSNVAVNAWLPQAWLSLVSVRIGIHNMPRKCSITDKQRYTDLCKFDHNQTKENIHMYRETVPTPLCSFVSLPPKVFESLASLIGRLWRKERGHILTHLLFLRHPTSFLTPLGVQVAQPFISSPSGLGDNVRHKRLQAAAKELPRFVFDSSNVSAVFLITIHIEDPPLRS